MNVKILDCTLRDGGYYTLWDFDAHLIEDYIKLVSKLPVDYIELGYRSIEKNEYFGEFFYSPVNTIKKLRSKVNKTQKISLMINAKDCVDIDFSKLLYKYKGFVELIRIAVDPLKIEFGLKIAKIVKSFGFEVAVNLMYISKIDEEHKIYSTLENIESYVDYLYLVDSYGSVYPDELQKIIKSFQKISNVNLGFHGHNNLELAFVNSLTAMENGVENIDSTILGMGRGAGNLKLELLLTYLKSKKGLHIDINILSQLIELFSPLQNIYKWGTNLPYMVSGMYSLPQKDIMDAIEINRYSIASLVNTMSSDEFNTLKKFKYKPMEKKCVIIGGGLTVETHIDTIKSYLKKDQSIFIIHSTSRYIRRFKSVCNKQLFSVAGDELTKLSDHGKYDFIGKFIFEPSPRKINVNIPKNKKFFELDKIGFIEKFHDSPLAISLQMVVDMGIEEVELIGFDGYTEVKSKKELYLMQENQAIITAFSKKRKSLITLTKTNYKDLIRKSIYSKVEQ